MWLKEDRQKRCEMKIEEEQMKEGGGKGGISREGNENETKMTMESKIKRKMEGKRRKKG